MVLWKQLHLILLNLNVLVTTFFHTAQITSKAALHPRVLTPVCAHPHTCRESFWTVIQAVNEDVPQVPGDLFPFVTGCQLDLVPGTQTIQFPMHVAVPSPSWQVTNWGWGVCQLLIKRDVQHPLPLFSVPVTHPPELWFELPCLACLRAVATRNKQCDSESEGEKARKGLLLSFFLPLYIVFSYSGGSSASNEGNQRGGKKVGGEIKRKEFSEQVKYFSMANRLITMFH